MRFAPPRRKGRLWINVTSLIDVMFLLLIFFLVSSTFKHQPAIKLELPRVGGSTSVDERAPTVYLTRDGRLYLDDRAVDEQELSRRLRARLAAGGDQRVILRVDAHVEFEPAARVFSLLQEAGYQALNISVRREP